MDIKVTNFDEYNAATLAIIEKKEKNIKLDNLLSILNLPDFEIEKIKIEIVTENGIETKAHYGQPKVNERLVLEYKDVSDINSFKVKGYINDSKVCITENFVDNFLEMKYSSSMESKDLRNLEKLLKAIV